MKTSYMHEFLILAKHLNFASAAQALRMTQPTLSRHINSLEEELGVTLLDRTRHSVSLTPSGENAVIAFDFITQHCDALVSQLGKIAYDGVSGLAFGMAHLGPGTLYGNHIMEYLEEHFPGIPISSVRTHILRIPANLERAVIDAAVVMNSPHFEHENIHNFVIDSIPLYAVVKRGHPWVHKASVSLEELATEYVISPHHPFDELPFIEMLFQKKNIEYLGVESDSPLDSLLDYGNFRSMVHVRSALHTVDVRDGLFYIPIEHGTVVQHISILCQKENPNPNLQTLIDSIPHIPRLSKNIESTCQRK